MGKVFSWGEIANGAIPYPFSFSGITRQIREDLEDEKGVFGAILCGSNHWNSCNQRSDIDCVVAYDPAEWASVMTRLQNINRAAARDSHVPVEFIPLDMQMARTPLHHIGLSFASHLDYSVKHGGLIKGNPLPYLFWEHTSPREDVCGYLRNKLRSLEKGLAMLYSMEVEQRYRFLQKVLEVAMHVARKVLWFHKSQMPDDAKRTVAKWYPELVGINEKERALFKKLTDADTWYTAQLLGQLTKPDKLHYANVIEEIQKLAWAAMEFVRLNALGFV